MGHVICDYGLNNFFIKFIQRFTNIENDNNYHLKVNQTNQFNF